MAGRHVHNSRSRQSLLGWSMLGSMLDAGVIPIVGDLPGRHRFAVVVSGAVALASVGLETISLALLAPLIEFMADKVTPNLAKARQP